MNDGSSGVRDGKTPALLSGDSGHTPFDGIRHGDESGEHWFGRELMPLMGYAQWRDFGIVVEKARASLVLVQGPDAGLLHFVQVRRVTDGGRWGTQTVNDLRLTRFGAYLVAMAGDDTKSAVAQARVYFAVRAREAEVARQYAIPQNFADALELAARQARELETERARVATLEPKATYVDAYVQGTEDATIMRVLANQLQVQEKALREFLIARKVIYRRVTGTRWSHTKGRMTTDYEYQPSADHKAWFVVRDQPEAPRQHNGQVRTTLYVTPIGKVRIGDLLKRYPLSSRTAS